MSARPKRPEPNARTPSERAEAGDPRLTRARRLANFLDARFRIPGTSIRFGWDPIIGLIPGGDLVTGLWGLYLLREAWRLKIPRRYRLAMAANLLIDALVGLIPVLGDAFDVAFRSNARNLRLLEKGLL